MLATSSAYDRLIRGWLGEVLATPEPVTASLEPDLSLDFQERSELEASSASLIFSHNFK